MINDSEAKIVTLIFDLYLYGDDGNPLTLWEVAGRINAMGVPIPKTSQITRNGCWQAQTVRRIITDEAYTGRFHYGKTRNEGGKRIFQPHDKWIPIDAPHLAIIDSTTFQAAQEQIERNKRLAKRNQARHYLLSGFFKCSECNKPLTGRCNYGKGKEPAGYQHAFPQWGEEPCKSKAKYVPAEIAEKPVWC